MRIGFFSPVRPMASGISDFSEELLPALAPFADIHLFSPRRPGNPALRRRFPCHAGRDIRNPALRNGLDLLVYQMGNHPAYHEEIARAFFAFPGILELHDLSLHDYMVHTTLFRGDEAGYLRHLRHAHGPKGLDAYRQYAAGQGPPPWAGDPLRWTLNRHFIDAAQAVIVHSDLAKQMVRALAPEKPVIHIGLHCPLPPEAPRAFQAACKAKLGIEPGRWVLGAFGIAAESKRILPILRALAQWKEQDRADFLFCVVGDTPKRLGVQAEAKRLGLTDQVRVTGSVSASRFDAYLGACDFCLNLRYPYKGESSSSLHRMLGRGKPVILTNIGAFAEYPDAFALKIRHGPWEEADLLQALRTLTADRETLFRLGEQAQAFARSNFSLERNARRYMAFFQQVLDGTWTETPPDAWVDELMRAGKTEPEQVRAYVQDKGL